MPGKKNSHCSFCGAAFVEGAAWPRTCTSCTNTSYVNPLPVAVLVVPVEAGFLLVRRGIEPRKGQLAFPGGFIELGEAWQAAACREVREETGLLIAPETVSDHRVLSAPDGTVLIFGRTSRALARAELASFRPTPETSELVVATAPVPLAFPLHEQVLRGLFGGDS